MGAFKSSGVRFDGTMFRRSERPLVVAITPTPPPAKVATVAVATDRSPGACLAVEWGAAFARSSGAELVAIQVVAPADPDSAAPAESSHDLAREELERSLPADGLSPRAVVVAAGDDVAAQIVAEAERHGADLVVIGSSGMRGRKQFLLGNVANRVTHLASCTVVVVNTHDGKVAERESDSDSLSERAAEIARVLGPLGLRRLSGRVLASSGDPEGPRELREALERLGPTFGKLGQILSTRPDLLPPEYLEELASLQSDVPRLTEAEVVAAMERELGVPWEDVFSTIEPEPLAAGTIGQVHRARLADGTRVVVKVRRPGAAEVVERDLELLARAVKPVSRIRRVRRVIDLPSLVEQVSGALREELDFTVEARNLDRMGEILASNRRVAVPGCHRDLSSGGLLVIDEIVDGVPLAEAPAGEPRTAAARELLHAYYKQVLDAGFFHADPHPGNLMWADETIWLLDLGMVGRLGEATRRQLMLVLLAFAQGDAEMLADLALDLGGMTEELDVDMTAYQADLGRLMDGVRGRSLQEIQLIELLNELTAISVRHGVPLPSSIAMVGKALAQVELTVSELAPELDPIEEAGRYFVRSVAGRFAGRLDPQRIVYEVERLRYRLGQVGEGLATAAGNRPGRQLEVRFTSHRLEQRVARAGRLVGARLRGRDDLGRGDAWPRAPRTPTRGSRDRCAASPRGSPRGWSPRPSATAERRCRLNIVPGK